MHHTISVFLFRMAIIEVTETDFPGVLVLLKYIYDALVSISNVYNRMRNA